MDRPMELNPSLPRAAKHSPKKPVRAAQYGPEIHERHSVTLPLNEARRTSKAGRPAVFEFIYRLHLRRVYALCLRMVRDPDQAEDLTQETFIQVFRKIHTFRGEAAFSSWLYRLTTNLVLMSFRHKTPLGTSLDQITSDSSLEFPELAKPDVKLSGLFDRLNLQAAVPLLPRRCKTAFLLHDVQGYTHMEIATLLGCSVGASKSYLYRAHKRLRALLQKTPHERRTPARSART